MLQRINRWMHIDDDNPGFKDCQCLVTYINAFDGVRYVEFADWNARTRQFEHWGQPDVGDKLLAWMRVSSPFDPTGDFFWRGGGKTLAVEIETAVIWNPTAKDGGRASFGLTRSTSVDYEYWAPIPEPFDCGDGSPWYCMNTRSYESAWKLKDVVAQRRWNMISGGMEFGRNLHRTAQAVPHRMIPEYIFVNFKGAPALGLKIAGATLVRSRPYNKDGWNSWPETVPPRHMILNRLPMTVHYKDQHGVTHYEEFFFDGERFYNDTSILMEAAESGYSSRAKVVTIHKFKGVE